MFTQALKVYMLSVKWLRERKFLRNYWMLSMCQLSFLFSSLSVMVDVVKMFELRLGEKVNLRHCLGLPLQEFLFTSYPSFFIFFERSGVANKVDVEFSIIEFYSWSVHWDEWGYWEGLTATLQAQFQTLVSCLKVVFAALPTEDSRCFKTQCSSFQSKTGILIILRQFVIMGLLGSHCSICSWRSVFKILGSIYAHNCDKRFSFLLLIRAKMIWAVLGVYKKALSYAETNSSRHALKSTCLKKNKKIL